MVDPKDLQEVGAESVEKTGQSGSEINSPHRKRLSGDTDENSQPCKRVAATDESSSSEDSSDSDSESEDSDVEFEFNASVMKSLKDTFGLVSFRSSQRDVVMACLRGDNCLVQMATAGGKSLCFQLPAVLSNGVTIVVTPFKASIKDQVEKLTSLGIPCVYIFESQGDDQYIFESWSRNIDAIKLIYVTPEKYYSSWRLLYFLSKISLKIARIVIDDAHYLHLPVYGKDTGRHICWNDLDGIPKTILTSACTPALKAEMVKYFDGQKPPKIFETSLYRPNLELTVVQKLCDINGDIVRFVSDLPKGSSGIVYCSSTWSAENVAASLMAANITARVYIMGLSGQMREAIRTHWMANRLQVICAVDAFSMGVDKPDVRFVIHATMPHSLAQYYQEIGRAGRDGNLAHCRMYLMPRGAWNSTEKGIHDFCLNIDKCRHMQLLEYFGQSLEMRKCVPGGGVAICDNCQNRASYRRIDVLDICRKYLKALHFQKDHSYISDVLLGTLFEGWNEIHSRRLHAELATKGYMTLSEAPSCSAEQLKRFIELNKFEFSMSD